MPSHEAEPSSSPADLIRALRTALGLTQEKLADLCGMTRVEMNQLEGGKNKGTSYAVRANMARGVDLPVEALAAYLDGEITLAGLLSLRGTYASTQWWRSVVARQEGRPVPAADPAPREMTPVEPSHTRKVK